VRRLERTLEPPREVRRIEVITGEIGRRTWSADDKARILEETLVPGAVVSEIARRHGLTPQQVFDWRRRARVGVAQPLSFVPVTVEAPEAPPKPGKPPRRRSAKSDLAIELDIAGVTVRIGGGARSAMIKAVIAALRAET
jgi:transposase